MYKKHLSSIVLFILATTSSLASYAELSAVNKTSCDKVANTSKPFILVLDSGDELISSISECAEKAHLKSAAINGLGQLHDPTLAYFSSNPADKPTLTTLHGYYELASLTGNVTNNGGKYYTHLHGVLADKKFSGIAGHVNSSKIGLTAEITITPLSAPVERSVNEKTGFGPIVH